MKFFDICLSHIEDLSVIERDKLFAKIYYKQLRKHTSWNIDDGNNIGKLLYQYAACHGKLNVDRTDYNEFNYFCDEPSDLCKIYTCDGWNIGYCFFKYKIMPNKKYFDLNYFKKNYIPLNQKNWPYSQSLKDAVYEIEQLFNSAKVQYSSGIKDNCYQLYFVKFYDGNFKKFLGKNYEHLSCFDKVINKIIPKNLIINYQKRKINKGLQRISKKYFKIINELFAYSNDIDFVNGDNINVIQIKNKYKK